MIWYQMLASVITVGGSFLMMLSISPLLMLIFVVTIPASVFDLQNTAPNGYAPFTENAAKS